MTCKQFSAKKSQLGCHQQAHQAPKRHPIAPVQSRFKLSEQIHICSVCKFEFPTENHFQDRPKKICHDCFSKQNHASNSKQKLSHTNNSVLQLTVSERQRVKELMSFRVVKEKLLYVIGTPKHFADVNLLSSEEFYGQFGEIEKMVINHNPRNDGSFKCGSENQQVAIYVHYKSPIQVAIAIKSLNGLRLQSTAANGVTLRCSFGTSKYCANFLSNSHCDAYKDGKCPFIHYLERRRDKVIQDDVEFKDYLGLQDYISNQFCWALGLQTEDCGFKNSFCDGPGQTRNLKTQVQRQMSLSVSQQQMQHQQCWDIVRGLPGPYEMWGTNMQNILKMSKQRTGIEQMRILPNKWGNDQGSALYVQEQAQLKQQQQLQSSMGRVRDVQAVADGAGAGAVMQGTGSALKPIHQISNFEEPDQQPTVILKRDWTKKISSLMKSCKKSSSKAAQCSNKENQMPEDFFSDLMDQPKPKSISSVMINPEEACSSKANQKPKSSQEKLELPPALPTPPSIIKTPKVFPQSSLHNAEDIPYQAKKSLWINLPREDKEAMVTATWAIDQVLSPEVVVHQTPNPLSTSVYSQLRNQNPKLNVNKFEQLQRLHESLLSFDLQL